MKTIKLLTFLLLISGFASGQSFFISKNISDIKRSYLYWDVLENTDEKICYKSKFNDIGLPDSVIGNGIVKCFYFDKNNICIKEILSVDSKTSEDLIWVAINSDRYFKKVEGGYLYEKDNVLVKMEVYGNKTEYTIVDYKK